MTAIHDNVEKRFDFEADAYLASGKLNPALMATTGQRVMMGMT